jgi:hypothetical protein
MQRRHPGIAKNACSSWLQSFNPCSHCVSCMPGAVALNMAVDVVLLETLYTRTQLRVTICHQLLQVPGNRTVQLTCTESLPCSSRKSLSEAAAQRSALLKGASSTSTLTRAGVFDHPLKTPPPPPPRGRPLTSKACATGPSGQRKLVRVQRTETQRRRLAKASLQSRQAHPEQLQHPTWQQTTCWWCPCLTTALPARPYQAARHAVGCCS